MPAAKKLLLVNDHFGLQGSQLQEALVDAEYRLSFAKAADLKQASDVIGFDAAFFVLFAPTDLGILESFMQGPGGLYISAGDTGQGDKWNGFLAPFGFQFNNNFDTGTGNLPISSTHPVFAGPHGLVDSLYQDEGNSIVLTNPPVSGAEILDATPRIGTAGPPLGHYAAKVPEPPAACQVAMAAATCTILCCWRGLRR